MAILLFRHRHIFLSIASEEESSPAKSRLIWSIIQLALLVTIWTFFAVLICITPPDDHQTDVVSLPPHLPQFVKLLKVPSGDAVRITLHGSINVLKTIHRGRVSENELYVGVRLINYNNRTKEMVWKSGEWKVYVYTNIYKVRTVRFDIELKEDENDDGGNQLKLLFLNHKNETTGFSLAIDANPFNQIHGIFCGLLLMALLYILLIFNIMDPIFAAWLVACGALGVLCLDDSRPKLATIIGWIDVEALVLLFGMMIMVAILSETGLFDYLAVFAYQLSRGNVWYLLFYLCLLTSVFSAIVDNVSTFTLMLPVTLRLCQTLQLNSTLVIISIAIFSNIGGTMTPVGDTANAIIGQDKHVTDHGITFLKFSLHMLPGVVAAMVVTFILLYFLIRNELFESKPADPLRATRSTRVNLLDHHRHWMESNIRHRQRINHKELHFMETLEEMKTKYRIRNKPQLIKCCICFGFALIMFGLQSMPGIRSVKLCWSVSLSAILLVMLVNQANLESIMKRVEWSHLVYLAALFVLMECLVEMGFIDWLGQLTINLVMSVDKSQQLTVAILLLMWTGALGSACVDAAPITTMMLKVTIQLAARNEIPFSPLIWALSFGVCLGGNSSLIGASMRFLLIGLPITIATVFVSTVYLLIAHCLFHWHGSDDMLKI
ncbi:P protein-like [Drosophila sulfurigaster albostrigata]|uniref:P protein-like n=1 Tax=Drosophila sulfurigaster albostrigata TaxID=89887 RepID=UPI002D21891F|nr:P protein-like [Drosophila sulfurigaster albostrigata]